MLESCKSPRGKLMHIREANGLTLCRLIKGPTVKVDESSEDYYDQIPCQRCGRIFKGESAPPT